MPVRTVSVGGRRVAPRILNLIDDAYRAVGLDPARYRTIVQGSYNQGVTASGGTHDGNGVVDLRVWNLPQAKVEPLVVELRKRNCAAWLRDKRHGGFDPHIHLVVIDAPDKSRQAAWQADDYARGGSGLSGSPRDDYHPRPHQRRWPWKARATAVRRTTGRRGPGEQYPAWRTRKPGFSFVSTTSRAVLPDGEVWLRTRAGFWYRAADFTF
ncbi:MAG: hypothetical protein ACRCSL_11875 [Microbacterium sp.]